MPKKETAKKAETKKTTSAKASVDKETKEPKKKPVAKKAESKTTVKKTVKKAEKPVKEEIKVEKENDKRSRRYFAAKELVEEGKEYEAAEALELAKKTSNVKFDASVELHIRLNVDPGAADQQVRGTVVLPGGTGKTKRVAVIAGPGKEKEAKDAGADRVGGDDLIAEIEKGKIDFDILVATPDMMPHIGKLGRVLGVKGLMPSPKAQTVTPEVGKAVAELKAGRIEYRTDKNGIVHQTIGKVSFDSEKLLKNYEEFMNAIKKGKPAGVKGTFIESVTIATTMGPGIPIKL